MDPALASSALRQSLLVAAALIVTLVLPTSVGAESEHEQPGQIEGVVTRAPSGARVKGVEVCAFDVAEDEEFTECTETKSNGSYEVIGLGEGPYRVEFKPGTSGLDLATQYYRDAATPKGATNVRVREGKATTGIDAEIEPDADGDGFGDEKHDGCPQSAAFQAACPAVDFEPGISVSSGTIQVNVKCSARTPVAVTGAVPGPGPETLKARKTVAPGKATIFTLSIPPGLASRLQHLDSSRSLTLTLRAHATKVKGKLSTDHLSVRLPGQG